MTLASVLADLKTTLEAEGLERKVFEFGYDIASAVPDVSIVIMRLGGSGEPAVDYESYGGGRESTWDIILEALSATGTGSATEIHQRLIGTIDTIIAAIDKWPRLGRGAGSSTLATVLTIGGVNEVIAEQGTTNWLMTPVVIRVVERTMVTEAE